MKNYPKTQSIYQELRKYCENDFLAYRLAEKVHFGGQKEG